MWIETLTKAMEYGLIAVLFVVLLRFVMTNLYKKVTGIEKSLSDWSTFIRANSPLGVTNEQAKRLIDISFSRDMFEIMDYISTELIFRAKDPDISEQILSDRLIEKMNDVLKDTRRFLGNFRTSKGSIKEPLDNQLPLSEGLKGREKGDQVFTGIANEIVTYLRNDTMNNEEKLHEIKKLAQNRREDSRKFLMLWLEGKPA